MTVLYTFSLLSAAAGLVIFLAGGERTSVTIFVAMTVTALVGIAVLDRLSTALNPTRSKAENTGTRLVTIGRRRQDGISHMEKLSLRSTSNERK